MNFGRDNRPAYFSGIMPFAVLGILLVAMMKLMVLESRRAGQV